MLRRLLRRAAERRVAAIVAFALGAAAQFWAMRVPVAETVREPVAAAVGDALMISGIEQGGMLLRYQGRGNIDVRFDRARLAAETAMLLTQLGVDFPRGEGAVSWVTTSRADAVSVLAIETGDPATAVPSFTVRSLPAVGERVAEVEIEAAASLQVTIGTSSASGAPRTQKLLRLGGREIQLDGELPLRIEVTAASPLRIVMSLVAPGEALRIPLNVAEGPEGGPRPLAVRAVDVRHPSGAHLTFLCAAPTGAKLWRGTGVLADGGCPRTSARLDVGELRIGADHVTAAVRGSGWQWRDGVVVGDVLLERVLENPALAGLVLVGDVLLAGWLLLAALSFRRAGRYRVFISYRRNDSGGHAGRLYARLAETFGRDAVFLDIERIPPGAYFERVLAARIAAAESVLVVIGPDWVTARDAAGQRRLDVPGDFVRREIEGALDAGKRVVPVLVGGAAMPTEDELPPSIRKLAGLNAFFVAHPSFDRDADALAEAIAERPQRDRPPQSADA